MSKEGETMTTQNESDKILSQEEIDHMREAIGKPELESMHGWNWVLTDNLVSAHSWVTIPRSTDEYYRFTEKLIERCRRAESKLPRQYTKAEFIEELLEKEKNIKQILQHYKERDAKLLEGHPSDGEYHEAHRECGSLLVHVNFLNDWIQRLESEAEQVHKCIDELLTARDKLKEQIPVIGHWHDAYNDPPDRFGRYLVVYEQYNQKRVYIADYDSDDHGGSLWRNLVGDTKILKWCEIPEWEKL
jgi:hypothetical protein